MPRLFSQILLLPVLFAGMLLPVSATATAARAAHAPAAASDSQIDATIRTKLAKSKIGKDGFHYKVSHGVVTWEGSTNVVQHKGSATRMAHAAGASQVVNNIQISAAAKDKAAAGLKKAHVVQ
jgi:BON domain